MFHLDIVQAHTFLQGNIFQQDTQSGLHVMPPWDSSTPPYRALLASPGCRFHSTSQQYSSHIAQLRKVWFCYWRSLEDTSQVLQCRQGSRIQQDKDQHQCSWMCREDILMQLYCQMTLLHCILVLPQSHHFGRNTLQIITMIIAHSITTETKKMVW